MPTLNGSMSAHTAGIIANVRQRFPGKIPTTICFGITGNGGTPNYQIEFSDGTKQPFYAWGKPYTVTNEFKSKNLSAPIDWFEFT